MAAVSSAQIKELREKTGAGMMDCKTALTEAGGDMDAAVDWLRKKGLAAAAKKSGRVAAEGLVGAIVEGSRGALVEVNSETDFVSRNPEFQTFVEAVTRAALDAGGDLEALKAATLPGGEKSIADTLTDLVGKIGENMTVRRTAVLAVEAGVVGSYIHAAQAPGLGKIGVLVSLQSAAAAEPLHDLARKIAMHVAAASPLFLSRGDVDAAALERERQVLTEQARASGKPDAVIEKMVEGRLRKYYEDVCLLEQVFVIDGESRVQAVVDQAAKDVGTAVSVTGFVRFALGEGVDKQDKDFASEVAEAAGA